MEPNLKPVAHYMSRAPVSVELDVDLAAAVQLMEQHNVRHLPVLDTGKIVGVVSERDFAIIESLVPDQWERYPVAEAMSTDPYTVEPSTPVREVARVMVERKYGSVLVAEPGGKLVGLFTTVDALRILAGEWQ